MPDRAVVESQISLSLDARVWILPSGRVGAERSIPASRHPGIQGQFAAIGGDSTGIILGGGINSLGSNTFVPLHQEGL